MHIVNFEYRIFMEAITTRSLKEVGVNLTQVFLFSSSSSSSQAKTKCLLFFKCGLILFSDLRMWAARGGQ